MYTIVLLACADTALERTERAEGLNENTGLEYYQR